MRSVQIGDKTVVISHVTGNIQIKSKETIKRYYAAKKGYFICLSGDKTVLQVLLIVLIKLLHINTVKP